MSIGRVFVPKKLPTVAADSSIWVIVKIPSVAEKLKKVRIRVNVLKGVLVFLLMMFMSSEQQPMIVVIIRIKMIISMSSGSDDNSPPMMFEVSVMVISSVG